MDERKPNLTTKKSDTLLGHNEVLVCSSLLAGSNWRACSFLAMVLIMDLSV